MKQHNPLFSPFALATFAAVSFLCVQAHAAEHVTLRNGAEFDCIRQESAGDRVRLYLLPSAPADAHSGDNYIEVSVASVLSVDTIPDPPAPVPSATIPSGPAPLTPVTMRQMLDQAGALHDIDADLLASIVLAESNGNPHAVSRVGAQGLMQLMPTTASALGVQNSFAPDQNISGGTTYLDQLLIRYHDDIRLAVAAYNAGPAAVDRYHGIPPFAETRAYVARVVREFNRRKRAAQTPTNSPHAAHSSLIAAN